MISLVINTKNAQNEIKQCIKSALNLFDELIIVDDGSNDNTIKIAKRYTDKIFVHESQGYVEPARNFAVGKASGDWILILDADEQISPKLQDKLKLLSKSKDIDFVKIPRKNIIFNKWIRHSGWWPDYQIRFFKKGKVKWINKIHAQPIARGREYRLPQDEQLSIVHYNYQTIGEFLTRMDNYTSIEVKQSVESGQKFKLSNLLSQPVEEFIRRYFIWRGYLDGLHGLILSLLQSFSFLVVQIKLWQESKFPEFSPQEVDQILSSETKKNLYQINRLGPKSKLQKIKVKLLSKLL